MAKIGNLSIVVFLLSGVASIMTKPILDGFDDEGGEMSVPRSPKIHGPDFVKMALTTPLEVQTLECLIEGSPTPTIIWSKDGQEIQEHSNLYNTTYNVTKGKAELHFLNIAKQNEKDVSGNFTCIAANFLGRVQKLFSVEVTNSSVSPIASTTISALSNISDPHKNTSILVESNTEFARARSSIIAANTKTTDTTAEHSTTKGTSAAHLNSETTTNAADLKSENTTAAHSISKDSITSIPPPKTTPLSLTSYGTSTSKK